MSENRCPHGFLHGCASCPSQVTLLAEIERLKGLVAAHYRSFDGHVYVKNEEWSAKCESEREALAQAAAMRAALEAWLPEIGNPPMSRLDYDARLKATHAALASDAGKPQGLSAIVGQWPGDETDAEVNATLAKPKIWTEERARALAERVRAKLKASIEDRFAGSDDETAIAIIYLLDALDLDALL